jgi:hypothetical protein
METGLGTSIVSSIQCSWPLDPVSHFWGALHNGKCAKLSHSGWQTLQGESSLVRQLSFLACAEVCAAAIPRTLRKSL